MSSIEKALERLHDNTSRLAEKKAGPAVATTAGIAPVGSPTAAQTAPPIQLDFEALARAGYLTIDTMHGSLAEQYRSLKLPLLRIANRGRIAGQPNQTNLIAITSALRAEGKTFTAFNLALSIAMERDLSVVLIDADLAARSLTHLAGLDDAPGLTDVLVHSETTVGNVIVRTNVPKLRLIPTGSVRNNTTELLASEHMRDVVGELATRYSNRIILFDTAPLLSSQAMVLKSLVGQVLIVVEEGETPQHAVQDAVSLLDKEKDVGFVLNKCIRLFPGGYSPYYGAP
jgi:protein-tyrosine kinase